MSESAGSGRADGGGQAGCPFVLAGCGASDHPSLSEASISRTPLSPPLLTPEGLSRRHVGAKWSLYTVLTGPTSLFTGHAGQSGKQPIIFFPGWSMDTAGERRDDY